MNTTPEQLRLAADILEKSLPYEFLRMGDQSWIGAGGYSPLHYLSTGHEIRLKPWKLTRHIPGFRPLRDGEEWHGSLEEWVESDLLSGERPVLKGEQYKKGDIRWNGGFGPWEEVEEDGCIEGLQQGHTRFKTRRPLPEPPKLVPLGPSDVPPGSLLRHVKWTEVPHNWLAVHSVRVGGVGHADGFTSYEDLETTYLILRPGQTDWLPCSKTA